MTTSSTSTSFASCANAGIATLTSKEAPSAALIALDNGAIFIFFSPRLKFNDLPCLLQILRVIHVGDKIDPLQDLHIVMEILRWTDGNYHHITEYYPKSLIKKPIK
jgi:hypothetical protein